LTRRGNHESILEFDTDVFTYFFGGLGELTAAARSARTPRNPKMFRQAHFSGLPLPSNWDVAIDERGAVRKIDWEVGVLMDSYVSQCYPVSWNYSPDEDLVNVHQAARPWVERLRVSLVVKVTGLHSLR
jgi:hypothetical protein